MKNFLLVNIDENLDEMGDILILYLSKTDSRRNRKAK